MPVPDFLRTIWKNYAWPALYAVGFAVAAEAVTQLTSGGTPFDSHRAIAAGIAAAVGFLGPRLNPYGGKDEPVIQPHQ